MAAQKSAKLIEATVDLMKSQISTLFNAALAAPDNQYNDGINLEPLNEDAVYISDKVQPVGMPWAFILAGSAKFDYEHNPNYLIAEIEAVIVVSSEEVGAEKMQRKAWRYQRVLYEALNQADLNSADGRLKIKIIPTRTGTTDPIATKLAEFGQKYRSDAVLEVVIQHYEKFLEN
jgi:hypothetical protein